MKVTTIKQLIENTNVNAKLVRAVIRQLGGKEYAFEAFSDIARHGIGGGFSGFIYYTDTVTFYKKNRKEIVGLVEDQADEFGQSPVDFVKGFNCLNDDYSYTEIAKALYGRYDDDLTCVYNALSWFAAEQVAYDFENIDY